MFGKETSWPAKQFPEKISSFIIAQQKSKKKAKMNYHSEPTASKYVTSVGKGDATYSPPFDVDKE